MGEARAPGVAKPRVDRDLMQLALVASGYDEPAARERARLAVEAKLAPIIAEVEAAKDVESRPALLLSALHRRWLTRYDARASTMVELLDNGVYNCLSAAIIYNIAAHRLGVTVEGEILPTHARSVVELAGGRRVIVEATSPRGFNPSEDTLKDILEQVTMPTEVGQRSIVTASGAIVPSWVLAGTIFVNRASLAQEAGDLETAERLFERGERLAGADLTRRVLRDQRAALLAQLAATDLMANEAPRTARAYKTLLAALNLDPAEPSIRATVEQNLRASAERMIAADADRGHEPGVRQVLEEMGKAKLSGGTQAGISAFGWSEIGRLRAQRNDLEGTLAAIDRGLEAELSAGDAHLASVLKQNRFATLRMFAMSKAQSGELQKSLELVQRLSSLPGLTAEQRAQAATDRARVLQIAAEKKFAGGDRKGAVELYRKAVALTPTDPTARHNLVAGLQQVTIAAVNAGRCEDVRAELDELKTVAPEDPFSDRADARCAMVEGSALLDKGDTGGAVEKMRAARRLRADDPAIRHNLTLALIAWAKIKMARQDCAGARPLLEEARALGSSHAEQLEAACDEAKR